LANDLQHLTPQLKGCPCCGLVQLLPAVPAAHEARCARCGTVLHRAATGPANRMAAAAALAALILYPLGVSLPVLRLEEMGHVKETSIWAGTISLLGHGQIVVGLIVFLCSIVIPLVKLAALFLLTAPTPWLRRRHQASVYHAIEWAGRWGMIDVLLVAILVAALKLGDLVEVHPGPGLVAFTCCVLLSLVATAFFNPHAIWEPTA
jgi:paraquat-inducible protein A